MVPQLENLHVKVVQISLHLALFHLSARLLHQVPDVLLQAAHAHHLLADRSLLLLSDGGRRGAHPDQLRPDGMVVGGRQWNLHIKPPTDGELHPTGDVISQLDQQTLLVLADALDALDLVVKHIVVVDLDLSKRQQRFTADLLGVSVPPPLDDVINL